MRIYFPFYRLVHCAEFQLEQIQNDTDVSNFIKQSETIMEQRKLINRLSQKISQQISEILTLSEFEDFEVRRKKDNSVVTNIDEKISQLVKAEILETFGNKYNFYCEEDHGELTYPAIVLDPIDGTKGLVTGTFECSVSLAIMETSELKEAYGWIFNPFTGFSISSDELVLNMNDKQVVPSLGLVSRSEWEKGIYQNLQLQDMILAPMGSIAYKLGLLAAGSCHFIISAFPKNIWDIAAGSILCRQRNIRFYHEEGLEITHLDDKLIKGPMFWCKKEFVPEIMDVMKQRKKK
jgi:myo-inositol-1(or 4)-monophosphatase